MDDIDLIVYKHAIQTTLLGDALWEIQVPAKNNTTLREAAKSAETWNNTNGVPRHGFRQGQATRAP